MDERRKEPDLYALPEAVDNCFGLATTVNDADGKEAVRFVENGNVVLMKEPTNTSQPADPAEDPQIYPRTGSGGEGEGEGEGEEEWESVEISASPRFVVKDSTDRYLAVLTTKGNLYIRGNVFEHCTDFSTSAPALKVVGPDGSTIVSMIDSDGNLKLAGYVLEYGIPRALRHDDPTHGASDYMSDHCYSLISLETF